MKHLVLFNEFINEATKNADQEDKKFILKVDDKVEAETMAVDKKEAETKLVAAFCKKEKVEGCKSLKDLKDDEEWSDHDFTIEEEKEKKEDDKK